MHFFIEIDADFVLFRGLSLIPQSLCFASVERVHIEAKTHLLKDWVDQIGKAGK